jgi:hypothetical protein
MDYDLSNMSILSFIREYEAIVKARKEETEYEAQRLPYEGADYKKLVKYVVESTKQFDQSLCWNWAESVLNQSLSITDMKAVTNRAIADLDNLGGVEDFGDEEKNKLINVYLAMRAMEMVRQQRGFFFKIFSFRINRREKEYFNQLVAAKDRFIARGFPVAELRQEVYVSIMKPVYEDVEKRLASQERAKEEEKERQEKLRNLPKVVDALKPRMQDPALKSSVVDAIMKKLPNCRWEKELQKTMLAATMMEPLIKKVQEGNEVFDEEAPLGKNPRHLMIYTVKMVFQEAMMFTASLGYLYTKTQLIAAQVITDEIMKNYSPVALDGKKYAEFAEGYMFEDLDAIEEIFDVEENEPYYYEAKREYNAMKSEKIQVPEGNVIANEPVVEPVQQETILQEPIINK